MQSSTVSPRGHCAERETGTPALLLQEVGRRRSARVRPGLIAVLVSLLFAGSGWAQEVGTIAELTGTAEVGRGGTWTSLSVGSSVQEGDTLHTGRPGRLRVVFQDDSVLTLGDDSQVVVEEQVFDPAQGRISSLIRLLEGKLRALVSDYYHGQGASYSVETVTAVSGVRGTEFMVIVDPGSQATEVVGVSGRVEVHSVLDRVGRGVFVAAREATTVNLSQYPTRPRRLQEDIFRQDLEKLQFVGQGRAESLVGVHPLMNGVVPEPDRASAVTAAIPPPWAIPPVASTDVRSVAAPDAGTLLQQPVWQVQATQGRVGIHF